MTPGIYSSRRAGSNLNCRPQSWMTLSRSSGSPPTTIGKCIFYFVLMERPLMPWNNVLCSYIVCLKPESCSLRTSLDDHTSSPWLKKKHRKPLKNSGATFWSTFTGEQQKASWLETSQTGQKPLYSGWLKPPEHHWYHQQSISDITEVSCLHRAQRY